MNREDIVVEIDAEISRLQQVKALLTGTTAIDSRNPQCQKMDDERRGA